MNKLLTFEGGQPFTIEDLSFLQESFIGAIESMAKSLAGSIDCILYGVRDTSGYTGAVYIGGNIYVLTKSITGGTGARYLCIRQTETEQRTFRDSVSRNIYLVDDAYMSETASEISIDVETVPTLSEVVVNGKGLWVSIGPLLTVEGEVLVPKDASIATRASMIVNIVKTAANDSNQLWSTSFRDPNEYRGITIFGNNAFIVVGSRTEGRVYNIDGSEYKGAITINNLELK